MHEPNGPAVFPTLTEELTEEQISWLSGYGRERELEDGEDLFKEEDRVDSFYVVLEGEIRIASVEGAGAEAEVATHSRGAFTGQLTVLAGKKVAHRARAVGKTRLLEISADAFRDVASTRPEVADVFIGTLARR